MKPDTNSRRTRVTPIFDWLETNAGADWSNRLVRLAEGLLESIDPGVVIRCHYQKEVEVLPSATRLRWMIENAHRLTPQDGKKWREYWPRVIDNPKKAEVLDRLAQGDTKKVPKQFRLEGATSCDCLIECDDTVIWVEGKRNDWLSTSTKWDVTRDQLARNVEAAWLFAQGLQKEFCVLICHEDHGLKHHERLLIDGYRNGSWTGGWPHLDEETRRLFGKRIGTVTWQQIQHEFGIDQLPE